MQICPELAKPPASTRCTASSRLASSSTMVAELLPSSSVTIFMPASLAIWRPTGGLPVKLTMLVRSSVTILLPMVLPEPTTTWRTPSGRPASLRSSPSRIAVSGRVGGRLEHDGVAAGQRRRHLVGDEVEREVERRDGGDHAARLADRPAEVMLAARVGVHLDEFAGGALGLLARPAERGRAALGLEARVLERLAALGGDDARDLLGVRPRSGARRARGWRRASRPGTSDSPRRRRAPGRARRPCRRGSPWGCAPARRRPTAPAARGARRGRRARG